MSQKRHPVDDDGISGSDGNNPEEKRQKVPALRNVILEAMKVNTFQKFLSGLEPLLRKVVKEEVEVALKKHFSKKPNSGNQVHPSTSRSLQLLFRNKLSLPIFTGSRIEGEEGSLLEVALVDAQTGTVVCSGPESSAKVEILVLEGDFEGGDDNDGWSVEEFNNNIVKEREGKRPLLTGDSTLNLKDGSGMLGELIFTDNSSWTRSRKFRLGARVVGDNNDGVKIREAKTEAFMVKDHRGELYKKHYPPYLYDEVWRLEKIGKDGAFHRRLTRENINTVKDFLTLLFVDALRLRNILGTGMSAKMWEVTVDHAQTCILDNRMYVYYPSGTQHKMGVVFSVVGQTLGVLSEGQCTPHDKLSETEKVNAHDLVKVAFEHWEEVISFDAGSNMNIASYIPGASFPCSSTVIGSSYPSQAPGSYTLDEFGCSQSSSTPSGMVSSILLGTRSSDNITTMQSYDNMDPRSEQLSSFTEQVTNSLDCEGMLQSFCNTDNMQYFDSDNFLSPNFCLQSEADLQTAVSSFLAMSGRPTSTSTMTTDKAHTRWTVLYSVLRWRFSIKKMVALKRSGKRETKRYG